MKSQSNSPARVQGSYYYGYDLPVGPLRGIRQYRKRRFKFSPSPPRRIRRRRGMSGAGTQTEELQDAKKRRLHEAQMIPGIDGHRQWGFPNTIVTKLRYCTFKILSASSGVIANNRFSANGLYDPDLETGGHQPMYYDQYTAIYDQYVVLGSKITVTYLPDSITRGAFVGIAGDDDTTTSGTLETLMEQNNAVSLLLGTIHDGAHTLSMTFEPNEMFGVDAKSDGASSTNVGGMPAEGWTYNVWAIADDISTVVGVRIKVEIEYTVKFSELKTPVQS